MSAGATTSKTQWPFSPQSIPGLSLWLDGADTSSITGTSSVTAWKDKSGKGNHASGNGGLSYTAGEGITFNGSNGYFTVPGVAGSIVGTPFTVFVVEKVAVLPSAGLPMGIFTNDPNANTTYGSFFTCYQPSGAVTFGWYNADQTTSTTYSVGTSRILNFNYTGTNRTILVNGTSGATQSWTQNLVTGAFTQPVIGRLWGTYYYNGTISELMLYIGNINTQQYQQVEGYLAQKWGLQILLPPTHPYFAILPVNTPPTSISGLSLWLDASDSTTKVTSGAGTNLVSIQDKSGSGNLWTPVTPNTISTNFNMNNGRPALSLFKAFGNNPLLRGTYTLTAGYNSTIFAVVQGRQINIFGDRGPTIGFGSQLDFIYYNADSEIDYEVVVYDIPESPNGIYILCLRVSATDSGSTYICSVNGTECLIDLQPNTPLASTGTTVITTSNTGVNDSVGELLIGEILVYSAGFNMSQIRQIEGYLAWKWGIQSNLPDTHPYYYAPSAVQLYKRPVFQRTFSPVDIPGCSLWLDAADLSTITGTSTVTAWRDKSGNGYSFTKASYSSGNITLSSRNGNSTVNLGINVMTTSSFPWTRWNTMFFVLSSSYEWLYSVGTLTNYFGTGNWQLLANGQNFQDANISQGNQLLPTLGLTNQYCLLVIGYGGGTQASNYTVNGTVRFTTAGTSTGNGTINPGTALPQATTTAALWLNGSHLYPYGDSTYVAEIVHYDNELTASQRQQVESYLAWKWGLLSPLATGHPGKLLPSFSTTFTPKSLTGLQLWLDAADSSTITGTSTVTAWADKSGNGNNGIPISSGPTLVQNVQNGLPGLTFPTTASIMLCGNLLAGTNFSMLAVVKYASSGTQYALGEWKIQYGSGLLFTQGNSVVTTVGTTSTYNPFGPLTPADTTAFHIYAASLSSSTSSSSVTLIAGTDGNDTTYTNSNGPNSAATAQPFAVGGAYENSTGYYPLTGYICEVIVYNSALSKIQLQQIEGYLAWKWGLQNNLPTAHAYKKFMP